jgi:two-component system LytT family response regulator
MPLTVLIVDDELLAREGLTMLLSGDPDVSAIHEASDGREAVTAIRNLRPDLVFLDVQMPEMDGFAVVKEIGAEEMPAVVFVTAHDQYAIRAFEFSAIDYLLKPVIEERFGRTLQRVKTRLHLAPTGVANRQIISLLEAIASPRPYLKRLAVRIAGKIIFVEVGDIDWIGAAENYVELHVGRSSHLLHVTMSTLEKSLDPETFVRIHRSTIVNAGHIKELQPALHGEYVVTLQDGVRLQSGRVYNHKLKALSTNPF